INSKKGLWNCRGCGVGGDVIKLVEHLDGVDFISACTTLTGEPPPERQIVRQIVAAEYRYEDENGVSAPRGHDDAARTARALKIWRDTERGAGTIVGGYLGGRGIE